MARPVTRYVLLLTVAALACACLAPTAPAEDAGPSLALARKLEQQAKFTGFEDPKTSLKEALDALAQRFDLSYEINEAAFKEDQINDVLSLPIAERPIPAANNIRLDRVLRKVLSRIPAPSGATYVVRPDAIEITTGQALRAEVWGSQYPGPFLPLVHTQFQEVPLEQALRELADRSALNVVLDVRAGDKAKTPVTARFLNTPTDTAVRLLADMAELKMFHLDNTLYVTSRENAARLESQERQRLEGEPTSGPRVGSGPGTAGRSAAAAGM